MRFCKGTIPENPTIRFWKKNCSQKPHSAVHQAKHQHYNRIAVKKISFVGWGFPSSTYCVPDLKLNRFVVNSDHLCSNSTPMVKSCTGWKRLSVNCNKRHDWPTPTQHKSFTTLDLQWYRHQLEILLQSSSYPLIIPWTNQCFWTRWDGGLHFLAAGTASSWAQTKEPCMAYSKSLLKRNAQC